MAPDRRPFVVAVTGGIASGKTAITQRFETLGVPVIDADLIAREVVAPGEPALREVAARFGPQFLTPEGALDRARMRAHVFAQPAERAALEAIVHPRVRDAITARVAAADTPYVILAIPLLVESRETYAWVDRVLVVDVAREVQLARLCARDRIDRAAAEILLAAQTTREARLAIADDVIVNEGPIAALDAMVATLHTRYHGLATSARLGKAGHTD